MAEKHKRKQDYLNARAASLESSERSEVLGRNLKAQYLQLQQQLQPQIDELQQRANVAAERFRKHYGEASEAYSSGAKASAKSLSIQGKDLQAECEHLNATVAAMRSRLNVLRTQYQAAFNQVKRDRALAAQAQADAKNARTTQVKLASGSPIASDFLETFLDTVPQPLLRDVNAILYDPNLASVSSGGDRVSSRGMTIWSRSGKISITIGTQPVQKGITPQQASVFAVAHELGHILYDKTSDDERAEWFALYEETPAYRFTTHRVFDNDEEDFAECARFWLTDKDALRRHDVQKEKFMKGLFERLFRLLSP